MNCSCTLLMLYVQAYWWWKLHIQLKVILQGKRMLSTGDAIRDVIQCPPTPHLLRLVEQRDSHLPSNNFYTHHPSHTNVSSPRPTRTPRIAVMTQSALSQLVKILSLPLLLDILGTSSIIVYIGQPIYIH